MSGKQLSAVEMARLRRAAAAKDRAAVPALANKENAKRPFQETQATATRKAAKISESVDGTKTIEALETTVIAQLPECTDKRTVAESANLELTTSSGLFMPRRSFSRSDSIPELDFSDAEREAETRQSQPNIPLDRIEPILSFNYVYEDPLPSLGQEILRLSMKRDGFCTFVGVYDLAVKEGIVEIYGATLAAGSITRIYSPAFTSVPAIVSRGPSRVEIRNVDVFGQCPEDMLLAHRAFGVYKSCSENDPIFNCCKYKLLNRSSDHPRELYPLQAVPEWTSTIGRISEAVRSNQNPVILVTGGRQSGKSTFSRFLTNSLLNSPFRLATSAENRQPIFFLDLDPTDQEFGLENQISLTLVNDPVIGSSITRTFSGNGNSNITVHAHAISGAMVRDQPSAFVDASMALFNRFKMLRSVPDWSGVQSSVRGRAVTKPNSVPLVIKFPSSIRGAFDEALYILIDKLTEYLTTVVVLPHAPDSPLSLFLPADEDNPSRTIYTLPGPPVPQSQYDLSPSEVSLLKQFSHFSAQSYPFPSPPGQLTWDGGQVSSNPPYTLRFSCVNPDFVAVHFPVSPPALDAGYPLCSAGSILDGALVAITVLSARLAAELAQHSTADSFGLPCAAAGPLDPAESQLVGWGVVRAVQRPSAGRTGAVFLAAAVSPSTLATIPRQRTVLQFFGSASWLLLEQPGAARQSDASRLFVRSTDEPSQVAFEGVGGTVLRVRGFGS